jgi:hypothetical protein
VSCDGDEDNRGAVLISDDHGQLWRGSVLLFLSSPPFLQLSVGRVMPPGTCEVPMVGTCEVPMAGTCEVGGVCVGWIEAVG